MDDKIDNLAADQTKNAEELGGKIDTVGKNLEDKMETLKIDINEIKAKQTSEIEERVKLGIEVEQLQEQVRVLTERADSVQTPDIDELYAKLLPKFSSTFSTELNSSHIQKI